ncbi:micronuclear linker histone polyprotein subunit, putative [Pediculus humanus corporis]|uniref:Micronuclear linker histone polyprotein subunit, putative n=1 Tax=Pediculus humanus subsp. corporis TaxID=121224 RepID=E0W2N2_PEDHC|nr:micronuclear linker histone polyprotein subunit, putative [Pediculus humanus corporis]EEB19888.1 micronuclear linker histone polyprotein subunit, putative [Pediculus humanus corporis]
MFNCFCEKGTNLDHALVLQSASVPTSYSSRLAELHNTTSRITNKERSDVIDNIITYRRSSKTDSDVAATLEKYGVKTTADSFRLRNESTPNRYLNSSSLDSKYSSSNSSNRKLCGSSNLELSKLSSSSKPPKSGLNSRLQRKDSLTKSESIDNNLSPVSSLERKISSSAVGGSSSSSSPTDIRKPEVWDKKLSVSYGENMSRAIFDNEFFRKVDNKSRQLTRVNENVKNDEKTLTFEEIRKKFDGTDVTTLKGGFDISRKSSQDESKASISNGVILGVHNFGQIQYLDRSCKNKKVVVDNFADDDEMPEIVESNNSDLNIPFSSPQTLRRTVLKPIPSSVKNVHSNSVLRKSSDANGEVVNSNFKKKSSPELKKNVNLSPEKKQGTFSSLVKLPAIPSADSDSGDVDKKSMESTSSSNVMEIKRDARNACINSKLGIENRNDLKISPKVKGEKLLTKIEQTLSKQMDLDNDILHSLSKIKKSPEIKSKDFENHTKVIELRRIEQNAMSPFEIEGKKIKDEMRDKQQTESPMRKTVEKSSGVTKSVKLEKVAKEILKHLVKDEETFENVEMKASPSPKEDKNSLNIRERELNKKLMEELITKDVKSLRKEENAEGVILAKEMPMWEKQDVSTNSNSKSFPGQASTSHNSNPHSFNDRVVIKPIFYSTEKKKHVL